MSTPPGTAPVLPSATLLRMLALLLLVLAPHALHLPLWETLAVLAGVGWRALHLRRGWPLPGRILRVALTLAAFAVVMLTYGRINGQQSGTALLVLMTVLKLLEMRNRRDVLVLVGLLYFLLLTHFLFSQEIWTLVWMLAATVGITALLLEVSHGHPQPGWVPHLRRAGVMVAQALPVMLVLFLLFPRIPGPLWGLPADAGAQARSGLPDELSLGDISELILSDAIAFRVRFDGPTPPQSSLYWRGTVFDLFDGRRWSAAPRAAARPALNLAGPGIGYEMLLEPVRNRSLLALEMTDPGSLPAEAAVDADGTVTARRRSQERRLYSATAHPEYQLQPEGLLAWQRSLNLRLPPEAAPRTRDLVADWQRVDEAPEAIMARALRHFRDQPFRYTLSPPRLGAQPVDEFLFDTRAGFCEHYASSFVVMMRAAGLPARVVIGYQGGESSIAGNDLVIRQSDAHAWAEVWLENRGWVRVDPTAWVSPSRIEQGLRQTFEREGELPAYLRRGSSLWQLSRDHWDALNANWNRWVLAYGPEVQREVLARLGIHDWTAMLLWLTGLVIGLLSLVSLALWWGQRPLPAPDRAAHHWRRLQRHLARRGLPARSDEGPLDYIERAAARWPALRPALEQAARHYTRLRYLAQPSLAEEQALARQVAALRRRLRHLR